MGRLAPLVAVSSTAFVVALSALASGCKKPIVYKPEPAFSGAKANLPAVVKLPPPSAFKNGANWTVYGLQHQLNSPRHSTEVNGKPVTVAGYVVKVYEPVEPAGKEGCIYPHKKHTPTAKEPNPKGVDCSFIAKEVEPPHFYIADSKDEKNPSKMIKVMGYFCSYIQLYFAIDWYKTHDPDKVKDPKDRDAELFTDNLCSTQVPNTFLGEPKVGAKVTISGQFGSKYEEGSGGRAVSPFGIVDVTSFKKGKIDLENKDDLVKQVSKDP